jgi:hypothetical protein
MTNHPLTDDIIESIALDAQWAGDIGDTVFRHSDMRAAYDKGADWQLEECINELNGVLSLFQLSGKINEAERLSLLNVFKNAMRLQEDNQ